MLAPADLPHQVQAAANVAAIEIAPVAVVARGRNRPAEQLGQQDLGQGFVDALRRAGQRIGHPHQQRAFFQPDLRVGVGVAPELALDLGQGSARLHAAGTRAHRSVPESAGAASAPTPYRVLGSRRTSPSKCNMER